MSKINKNKFSVFLLLILLFTGIVVATDVNDNQTSSLYTNNCTAVMEKSIQKVPDSEMVLDTSKKLIKGKFSKTTQIDAQTAIKLNEIYVNPNVGTNESDGTINNPYPTIQLAVKKSLKGYDNRIYLSKGNHILSSSVQISKTITIIGEGRDKTNISCKSNQGFRMSKNSNLTLLNLKMQHAKYTQGGAIIASQNSKLIISDCTFKKNIANNGAVIFGSVKNIKANITNSIFESNTGLRFGALHLGGRNSIYNINNCTFLKNILTDTNYKHSTGGAAIYASSYSKVNVNGSVFKSNKALWGNAILNGNHAEINITYSRFISNIAYRNMLGENRTKGGAIGVGSGYAEIGYCKFVDNRADVGGAISVNSGEETLIYSSTFLKNIGYTQAGAINNFGTLTLLNSVFDKNNGNRRGGAVLDIGNSEITIDGCKFRNNRVQTKKINDKNSLVPQGGAISISGACHNFQIMNSLFDHNIAYYGGAVYSVTDTLWVSVSGSKFINNTASYGGAMVVAGETTLEIVNNTFQHNRALKKGGAILINGSAHVKFSNTLFKSNKASATNGDGGAVFVMCYSKLYFNRCKFDSNKASNNGGAFGIESSATINIMRSELLRNSAKKGSVIYLDNSKTYKIRKCKVYIETSTLMKNSRYMLYSVKAFDTKYANNYITTSWWGSNVLPSNAVHNFKIKNYYIMTLNLDDVRVKTTWTKDKVTCIINKTKNIDKNLIISISTIKEGKNLRYTDAFLPEKTFNLKKNNYKTTKEKLYVYYYLDMNINKYEITLDNQKITLNIVK